jgi:putative hemolysin
MRYQTIALVLTALLLSLTACRPPTPTATPSPEAGMPNPASVYCEEQGGQLEIRTAEDGSQTGYCIFPDGSECEEWAFFRGECSPGGMLGMPNPASVYCEEQGGQLEIRTAEDGSQTGYCIFPDGSECEEWAFFRGECSPGGSSAVLSTDET